jgi:N-acetylglucosamine-6-phosphate deacetylase
LAANENLLAGSAQMLLKGIEHLTRSRMATLAQAWDMASIRPASFMNLETAGGLTPGAPADFVLFRRTADQIDLEATYKAGHAVFNRSTNSSPATP